MQSVWLSKNDYERRAKIVRLRARIRRPDAHRLQLLEALRAVQSAWSHASLAGISYTDARAAAAAFASYKAAEKRKWVAEKQELGTLYGNIQTRLRTYGLREWVPAAGMLPQDIDAEWARLEGAEAARSRAINAQIRECVA